MNKKELGEKLNEMLGVDWDWSKPLTKDQLEELYEIVKGLYDLLNDNEMDMSSLRKILQLAAKKKVKDKVDNILDKVLSGKGPIMSLIRGDGD